MPPVIPKSRRWSPACEGKSPTGLCSVPRRFLAEFIMIERQGLFPPLRVTSAEPGLALFGDGSRQPGRFSSESGQASVFVVLALGLFLLGAIGGAVDIANLWFHRQAAQTAADAACTAGAMDMLAQAEGSPSYSWITGKTSDCKGTTNVAPCQYAALNGYDGSGLIAQTPSNKVALSYPASVSGVTTPPAGLAPTPFLQVNITDRVKVFFLGMLSGNKTMDVGAKAVCGLVQAKSPVPIIVLNPTCPHAFQVSGSAQVNIIGGPSRSIQVNSNNTTCAAATQNSGCPTISQPGGCPAPSNSAINLCQGGPNFDGSSFGVTGAPGQPASGFNTQNDGTWSVAAPLAIHTHRFLCHRCLRFHQPIVLPLAWALGSLVARIRPAATSISRDSILIRSSFRTGLRSSTQGSITSSPLATRTLPKRTVGVRAVVRREMLPASVSMTYSC